MLDIISEDDAQSILNMKNNDSATVQNENTTNDSLFIVNELPSGFKGYPKDTKISYKAMTLGELEALNSGSTDITRGVAMLLQSINCNTLKPEDLYYWDVMYIGIKRKLLAFGDTRGVLYHRCPKCGEVVEKEFSYTDIQFKQPNAIDLPITVEIAGRKIEFNEITLKEFLQLDPEQGELGVYAKLMKNIKYEEALSLCKNLHGEDIRKIKFIEQELDFGMKPFFVDCPNTNDGNVCNQKVRMEVRSPFEVVFPQNIDFGHNNFEIQYGKV